MKLCVIMPIHNEAQHLTQVLDSFIAQSKTPDSLILVNDNSTDNSLEIATQIAGKHPWIKLVNHSSNQAHLPGAKVVRAFNAGLATINLDQFDLIGKFDADIVLPKHYFETLIKVFVAEPQVGMASGLLFIKKNNNWEYESIAKKSKIRGPLKLYRTDCFTAMNGLRLSMGWDTADVLLAQFYNWKTPTVKELHVQHLRPTGASYSKMNAYKQGQTFYALRYGIVISKIALLKLAWNAKSISFYLNGLWGYFTANSKGVSRILTKKQGKFARSLRYKNMFSNS